MECHLVALYLYTDKYSLQSEPEPIVISWVKWAALMLSHQIMLGA